jgi:Xaa-Pro dipeptidase
MPPKQLPFPLEEYRDRVHRLQQLLLEERLDALVLHHFPSVFYLSGYQSLHVYDHECVVVPRDGEPSFVVRESELDRARYTCWLDRIWTFGHYEEAGAALARALVDQGLGRGRIGVEKRAPRAAGLSVHTYESLQTALPQAELVDGWGLVERIKARKSPREVAYLRRAAEITTLGMTAAIEAAAEGATDNDVAAAAYRTMIAAGGDYMAIPVIVASGVRSSVPHSTHERARLDPGDVLTVELGGCYHRYSAPCMRTVSIGPPIAEVERIAEAALAALDRVLAAMRPGVTGDEVARAGLDAVGRLGDGLFWPGYFAYGVGAGFPPAWGDHTVRVQPGDPTPLASGMVMHVPVILNAVGRHGLMFSETAVITDDGCEVLTGVARRLFVR